MARYEAAKCCDTVGPSHGWGVRDTKEGEWLIRGSHTDRPEAEARAMAAALNGASTTAGLASAATSAANGEARCGRVNRYGALRCTLRAGHPEAHGCDPIEYHWVSWSEENCLPESRDLEICGNAMRGIADAAREEIERLRASYEVLTKRAHAEIKRLHDAQETLEKERDEARAECAQLRKHDSQAQHEVAALRAELADARGALARWRQAAKEMLEGEKRCGARHPKLSGIACVRPCAHDGSHDSAPEAKTGMPRRMWP